MLLALEARHVIFETKACHALDELTLPEVYVTPIKRQQRVGNIKGGELKAVNVQCSCNVVHYRLFTKIVIRALMHN